MRYKDRGCKAVARQRTLKWRASNRDKHRAARAAYDAAYTSSRTPYEESTRVGYICELLVTADLNARCGRAYLNPEPQTKDDIYAKTADGWRTVQVKKARVNRKTGSMFVSGGRGRRTITSDILALVDFDGRRVWYKPNTTPLPPELPPEPTPICNIIVFRGRNGVDTPVRVLLEGSDANL